MSSDETEVLKRALQREKLARKEAEKILENKSRELYVLSEELKKTNTKLESLVDEKSSQLQGVFENITDAYLVIDLEGYALKMNDAAIDFFGYNIEEEKLNVASLIYKEDIEYAFKSFKELTENGSFSNYIARIITKNKEVKWVHINGSLVYDKENKPIAAQGIIRDITEERRAKQQKEEQRKEINIIVDNAPFGIVLSQFGKILKTNKAIQHLLGYTETEFSNIEIKDISLIEDFPESKAYLDKMDSGELDSFTINKRYKKKNGSIVWAKTDVTAVKDHFGNIKYQIALIEDITAKRESTLIIDMINDIAKSILGKENIRDIAGEITNKIITYLDTEDCVIYLVNHKNNVLEKIAWYNVSDCENDEIVIPIGEGIVGYVAKSGKAEIVNDTSKDNRYLVEDKARLSEISVPIINGGKVIGIIDSEHKKKNYFTKEHLKTLENIASIVSLQLKSAINIGKREIVELKNSELLKELEKSNDELHEYAHIVSHDLKSPLRSINALVSWIKEDNKGKFDDISIENFNLIEITLEKMEQLISDILLYSSIGTEINEEQDVDLNLVLSDLKTILFIPENINIEVAKLPVVKGDTIKFQQLFQNLISNAIKFNNKEKGLIEVEVTENKSFYQFLIRDNGIGVEKQYHDKIFKIFHSLKESEDSSGIGLSIVKKIVDLYQGEVWVESELNIGTTFYFTIKK